MARPKLGASESKRLQMVITEDELKAIEDWQFANRVPSKSEAIRRLIQIGLLVENELEEVVDFATECVEGMTDQLREVSAERRMIINPSTTGIQLGEEEIEDIYGAATNRNLVALDAVEGLHQMVVTLYNAIAPLAEAQSVGKGIAESQNRIDEANAATQRAIEKRKQSEENRYLGIWYHNYYDEKKQEYEELPEEKKDEYLAARFAELAAEEEADPEAFSERYGLKRFWETAGWASRLRTRAKQFRGSSE